MKCVHLVRLVPRQRGADQNKAELRPAGSVGKSECIDRRTSFVRRIAHRFGFRSPATQKPSHHPVAPDGAAARRLNVHLGQLKRYTVERLAAIPQLAKQWEIVERASFCFLADRTNLSLGRSAPDRRILCAYRCGRVTSHTRAPREIGIIAARAP